ncbi:M16 family metallopeptidase [Iodobacter fluviatilis]|nr:insulinase family protein [Iodobacter fluviatilis]
MKILFCLLLVLMSNVQAAETKPEILPLLPTDVRHGQLANGLNYYIKRNAEPAEKVELRLLVNVGSLSEADDERGVAHLLEHMAFRRTKHFGPGALKAFLESQGMSLGGDINAFTFHEWTNYQISVTREALPQALQLLADWANGIEMDAAELALEREVVLDEGRLRQSWADFYQSLLQGIYPNEPQYSKRLAIGDADIVKNIPLEKVKAFYKREYQAQRMTLLIAGDFQPQEAEDKIKTLFAGIEKGTAPIGYAHPAAASGLRFFSHRNVPGIAHPQAIWGWALPAESMNDADAAFNNFKRGMLGTLLQQRLSVQARKDGSPFVDASYFNGHGVSLPTRQIEFTLSVSVKDKQMKEALQALYRELERAKRFGFSQQELAHSFEIYRKNQSSVSSHSDWIGRLQKHAQFGETARDSFGMFQQLKIFFAATTSGVLQDELKRLLLSPDQVATILLPPAVSSYSMFFEKTAQNIVDAVRAEPLENIAQEVNNKPLLAHPPQPGKIVSEQDEPTTEGTLFKLSNGIEVLITPPKGSGDRVGFSARAAGGMAALTKKLYPAGLTLVQYLNQAGLGEFSGSELKQRLSSQTELKFYPFVYADQQGLAGEVDAADIETLLQLQYLAWTATRDDKAAATLSKDLAYQLMVSNANSLYTGLNEKHYGALWPYPAYWQNYNFDASLSELIEARNTLFGNPRAFRFVLSGVMNNKPNKDLIEQYIASLPTKEVAVFKPEPLAHGRGNEIHQMIPQPLSMRFWHAYVPLPANSGGEGVARFLSQLVQQRLWQALRENTGETYGVYSNFELTAWQGLLLSVVYQTDIKQCDQAAKITVAEIARLRNEAPTMNEVNNVRAILLKAQQERRNKPIQNAEALSWYWLIDGSVKGSAADFANFTPEYIHQYARSWLGQNYWAVGNFNCQNTADLTPLAGD